MTDRCARHDGLTTSHLCCSLSLASAVIDNGSNAKLCTESSFILAQERIRSKVFAQTSLPNWIFSFGSFLSSKFSFHKNWKGLWLSSQFIFLFAIKVGSAGFPSTLVLPPSSFLVTSTDHDAAKRIPPCPVNSCVNRQGTPQTKLEQTAGATRAPHAQTNFEKTMGTTQTAFDQTNRMHRVSHGWIRNRIVILNWHLWWGTLPVETRCLGETKSFDSYLSTVSINDMRRAYHYQQCVPTFGTWTRQKKFWIIDNDADTESTLSS